MFLYESEASRLQKKQWFLPWKQECYLKKRHFSYRIVPKVLEEMNGNNQKMPLLVTLKFLVQVKMQFPVKFKEKFLGFIQLFNKCYPWLST